MGNNIGNVSNNMVNVFIIRVNGYERVYRKTN